MSNHEINVTCTDHTLVVHVAVLHHSSALLVKYDDTSQYDNQPGWFLPNDELKHVEHPEVAAKRVLKSQAGIENAMLKLVDVESFIGDARTWHLSFDYLAFPTTMKVAKGEGVAEARWFEIDELPDVEEFAHKGWGRAVLMKHARVAPLAQ
jgi:ADP-ribose pyrophosphatase YjhB (NUDIX family)